MEAMAVIDPTSHTGPISPSSLTSHTGPITLDMDTAMAHMAIIRTDDEVPITITSRGYTQFISMRVENLFLARQR